jgi:hypothetical protein
LEVEVCTHSSDPPDPWAGYKQCLTDIPDCTHLLVVQDDVIPCRNFVPALEQIAEARPDMPVCLFMGDIPASTAHHARIAMIRGVRYTRLHVTNFMPLVAVLWPRAKAEHFLAWGQNAKTTRADDGNAAKWMRQTRQSVLVSVPSLVEHNDFVPSVKGGRDHKYGAESWRRAQLLADDGLDYDWSVT